MNPLNKYEAVGIFLSVAVMAIALSVVRFQTDAFAVRGVLENEPQTAVVALSEEETKSAELEAALKDATTSSGELVKLVTDDVRIGTGDEVKKGDTLTVHYVGTTQDGVRFDSSYERGSPYSFTVGAGTVIKGWDEGLLGMKVGGQRILVIPPSMGYGSMQVGSIPPNSPLVFSVELLKIE